jgi:phenylalanyl-tRNA synthetase beta chain
MLVSFNWLKEYVDLEDITPDELGEKFTLGGLEVETIQKLGEGLNHLVVGEVETCEPLEGSDHLNKTTVNVGNEVLPIICGAPNVAAGQKVVVAKVGAILPGNFEIKKAKIMGETSEGMIVSLDELGFPDSIIPKHAEDGIYVLNEEAEIGADARPYVGLDDAVIEFDLTPNRADALSMRGVAYEVGALLDQVPSFDEIELEEDENEKVEDYVSVSVENTEDTLDYRMRIVKDVKIGESPLWMQHKLMHAGIRPIDLVVDITNYVMLEFGQPLHAFDYDKLESKKIHVRRANPGEELVTLDGQTRKLIRENLVITNGEKAVALAGVMGGENSQITEDTKTIAIESAVFNPVLTRRTANRLNLRSESSNRFEKGVNIATVQDAADLAAKLMVELGGGRVVSGTSESSHTTSKDISITTTVDRVNRLIGGSLTDEEISSILDRLGFNHKVEESSIEVSIPTRRWDIEIAEDLIEEIARIYGYNNIPVTLPVTESTPGELTTAQKTTRLIRNNLEGNGMQEAISYSLTLPEKAERYAITKGEAVSLQNPMSKERVTLRQNIVSGLIDDATYNVAHQVSDIALYEIGHVFYAEAADDLVEYSHVAGLLTGESQKDWFGETETIDFYTVKGLVENLLSSFLFSEEITYQLATEREGMHPGRTADIYIGHDLVGYVGQIHPTIAKNSDLKDTFVFELSINKIVNAQKEEVGYTALNRYPGSSRDIALLVSEEVTHADLESVILENGGEWLQSIQLFDLYDGENIEDGKKSMAYSLYYANPNATLKEDEVNNDFSRVQDALIKKFDVEIR